MRKLLPLYVMSAFAGIFCNAIGYPATTLNGFIATTFVCLCVAVFYWRTEK